MPAVSEAQRKAMYAAAEGHSTLGIPKKVGEEFVGKAHDADPLGHAAGILFVAPDGDVLLLRRGSNEQNYAGHWALPGGGAEDGESPEETAVREATEEMGGVPEGRRRLLDRTMTPSGIAFHTFAQAAPEKFVPKLNDENSGYAWSPLDQLPSPIHPAVKKTLQDRLAGDTSAFDMTPANWKALRDNFVKWTQEEEEEDGHAEDKEIRRDVYAMDRSVRSFDSDGHLHVARTPISKANIGEYYGHEIPGFEELGLEEDKIYRLLRHPEELKKAAATSNGKQILLDHVPVSAEDHQPEITVGALGTDGEFEYPYLYNSMTIHAQEGIDVIEDESQREISMAYRYTPVMVQGEFEGDHYDGVMTDIAFNHAALVSQGRAGADVLVLDRALDSDWLRLEAAIISLDGKRAS